MRTFIVHAHHEPTSFNAAMTRTARDALTGQGHRVIISDLHAMGFDPVSDRRNFTTTANPERLKQQDEEALASRIGGYAPELQAEMEKLAWCDLLIFQFPLWWLGPPAILKGWIDRVFTVGRSYGGGRWFDTGMHRGKSALCSLTVGGHKTMYEPGGHYAPVEQILYPLHHGLLGFTGFSVLEPFVVYGPNRMSYLDRQEQLARYRARLLSLDPACAPLDTQTA
jgi:NAD(P)H dehydrogenase (quinone)